MLCLPATCAERDRRLDPPSDTNRLANSYATAWHSANQSFASVHARTSRNPARRSSALKSSSAYL